MWKKVDNKYGVKKLQKFKFKFKMILRSGTVPPWGFFFVIITIIVLNKINNVHILVIK